VIALKIHHALSDGFSNLKLLAKGSEQNDLSGVAQPKRVKRSFCTKLITRIFFFVKIPYDFVSFMLIYDKNEWHKKENALPINRDRIAGEFSQRIPMKLLKAIGKKHGVCFSAVINAGFTAAIRDAMINGGTKVPNRIHCMTPLPYPGHPEKLRNFM